MVNDRLDTPGEDAPHFLYAEIRYKYQDLGEGIRRMIADSLESADIPYHNIGARAKEVDSFREKSQKLRADGSIKYNDPLSEITDLAGVRVITYTIDEVRKVCDFISENFEIVERTDVGEERYRGGRFGYQSIHFLVRHSENRLMFPDFVRHKNLLCEIQVRTLLQHAWAEIEHDVQYKNQSGLPDSLQRKFTALAGLLEIADREFQSIRDEDDSLKQRITESLQEDLTKDALAETEGADKSGATAPEVEAASVRQLVKAKRYDQAIKLYNAMVADSPTMHTLFQGRARVKFLSGDRAGAIEDIESALALNSTDPATLNLLRQIKEGTVGVPNYRSNGGGEAMAMGNEALMKGDGVSAYEHYSRAQEEGAPRPLSILNKATACFVAQDYEGAKIQLGALEIRPGTNFSVTIGGMYALIYAICSPEKFDSELERLLRLHAQCSGYDFEVSVLGKLVRGLRATSVKLTNEAESMLALVLSELQNQHQQ
ncbi:ppGpp synthetase/RelA/SpoT-type nucleotidyltransferase [Devosia sp. UYZn731]|uniref:hypothetical protein n=1 Tax=Devosia sp. UYZn731 TaxID=3156345 RepID=UPI003394CB11